VSSIRRWSKLDEGTSQAGAAHGTGADDADVLKRYVRTKHEIARVLRAAQQQFRTENDPACDQCTELIAKLAEDRFTLAVVGQFKRGKSSLMNAILGKAVLPTGVLPLTSAITALRFGPRPRLVIHRANWTFEEEAPLSEIADYVTEHGNPGNRKNLRSVYVEMPSLFLRRGLEFVDTPGIGSAIEANTQTTLTFLPRCDAVLFLTAVDSPLTTEELVFLDLIREHVHKIFFVVNKIDLVSDEEREEVLRYLRNTLNSKLGYAPTLFAVSSRWAIEETSSENGIERQAGIRALEHALAEYLTTSRAHDFLQSVIYHAIRVARDGNRLAMAELIARLEAISEQVKTPAEVEPDWVAPSKGVLDNARQPERIQQATSRGKQVTDFFGTRGCAICSYLQQRMFDFFAKWQHRLASDEQTQSRFAEEFGFCPLHAWQLVAVSSPLGLSIGY
jgi:ribosome biogenesis GTPase A